MVFRKTSKKANKSFLSFDKFITGIIIGWAAASIFWLSKTEKGKNILEKSKIQSMSISKRLLRSFWKISVKFINIFSKK